MESPKWITLLIGQGGKIMIGSGYANCQKVEVLRDIEHKTVALITEDLIDTADPTVKIEETETMDLTEWREWENAGLKIIDITWTNGTMEVNYPFLDEIGTIGTNEMGIKLIKELTRQGLDNLIYQECLLDQEYEEALFYIQELRNEEVEKAIAQNGFNIIDNF